MQQALGAGLAPPDSWQPPGINPWHGATAQDDASAQVPRGQSQVASQLQMQAAMADKKIKGLELQLALENSKITAPTGAPHPPAQPSASSGAPPVRDAASGLHVTPETGAAAAPAGSSGG